MGLIRSATRRDLLLALFVTLSVEGLAVLALGSSHEQRSAATLQQPSWAVPINLQASLAPSPEAPASPAPLKSPEIKLGGGRPGRSHSSKEAPQVLEATSPRQPRDSAPVRHVQPIAAPPGPTTATPLAPPLPESIEPEVVDDDALATEGNDAPAGEGFPDGEADGTVTDPLQAHAIRLYRSRVQAWFASRFNLKGTGLPQATLRKLRASATISVDANRRMSGFSMVSSGNNEFDAAVRRTLTALRGMELPPSPAHYPGAVQGRINVEFICGESTCD